jgi:hypothetical protein
MLGKDMKRSGTGALRASSRDKFKYLSSRDAYNSCHLRKAA